jgi:hypothetical protein
VTTSSGVQPVQFPLGTTCQGPVWSGGSGTVTAVNQDSQFNAYIGYANTIAPKGLNTAPLGPGASMTFPGNKSLYAVGDNATMQPLLLMPGAVQYSPPPLALSVPLIALGSPNTATAAFTIPATNQMVPILPLTEVSRFASYDLGCYFYGAPANAGADLTIMLTFMWFDDITSGVPVFQEDWYLMLGGQPYPAGGILEIADSNPMSASGQMHGRYLAVYGTSYGNTDIKAQWFNLYGSSRSVPYSDWRQNMGAMFNPALGGSAINGLVLATGHTFLGVGFDNQLQDAGSFAPGAGSLYIPLPLYSGPVVCSYSVSGAVLTQSPTLVAVTSQGGGGIVPGTAQQGQFWSFGNVLNTQYAQTINFPRCPVLLVIHTAAGSSINFTAIAQQGA